VKLVCKVKVRNVLGLHKLLQPRKSSVLFTYRDETINARSIMSILMLAAKKNSSITISVEGEDAQSTMDHLVQAFSDEFGEKK
jgi:phosphocarrier protein HPr